MACKIVSVALAVAVLAGCSGSGLGLDDNGQPLKKERLELMPYFENIRSYTFETACRNCHYGPSAAKGMDLVSESAYAALVSEDNFSAQRPELRQVLPGSPDSSYLYLKVLGENIIEARMPKDREPLSVEEMGAMREWIEAGAPEAE
jgi:hypothetical protein